MDEDVVRWNKRFDAIKREIARLPQPFQDIILDDINEAIRERIKVLELFITTQKIARARDKAESRARDR